MREKSHSGLAILIVEDDYMLGDEPSLELCAQGVEVIGPAAFVDDAAGIITESERIDSAILHPDLSGEKVFPAAELLMERGIPFVFTTGYDDDARAIPAKYAQNTLCEKPVRLAEVRSAIGR